MLKYQSRSYTYEFSNIDWRRLSNHKHRLCLIKAIVAGFKHAIKSRYEVLNLLRSKKYPRIRNYSEDNLWDLWNESKPLKQN